MTKHDTDLAVLERDMFGSDLDMIAGAWQGSPGRWYVDGRCKHLYPSLTSLSGVLTPLGEALRNHLLNEDRRHG